LTKTWEGPLKMNDLKAIVEALEETDEIGVAVGRNEALLIAQLLRVALRMRALSDLDEMSEVILWELGLAAKAWDAELGGEDETGQD